MKIVVAEKVAPSSLAVFKEQSDWTVVTPGKRRPGGGIGRGRCAAGALGGVRRCRHDGQGAEAARDRARGRGRGQHRPRRRHQARHRGDEHARRQRHRRGRTHAGADAGAGAASDAGRLDHARRQVGEEVAPGHRAARQDAGHRGPGQDRHGSRQAGAVVWHEGHCARSVRRGQPGAAVADHAGAAGGIVRHSRTTSRCT